MQNRMSMPNAHHRATVRRRPDGVVQIQALPIPVFSLGALRSLGLGVLGMALLIAALVVTPIWLAFGGRSPGQGRAGARTSHGASVTDLGVRGR